MMYVKNKCWVRISDPEHPEKDVNNRRGELDLKNRYCQLYTPQMMKTGERFSYRE